jgi:hypothetical protein
MTRRGVMMTQKMRSNAADSLAESEFNRFFIRGLCIQVLGMGLTEVMVTTGRQSKDRGPEYDAFCGKMINAQLLLDDLRTSKGRVPKLFPYIESGQTVCVF